MNILIVDDERNIRLTLRDILEDEGYQTVSAQSGEEALEILTRENVDLIILDVKLPGIDGIEVYKKVKAVHPDLDVLMISGHGTIETAVEAVKLGAYDFLEKPLSMAKILTSARNINEKRKLLSKVQQEESAQDARYQLVGESPQMVEIKRLIAKVAPTDSKVLIRGESGTGKELVAYAIHRQSKRKDEPFIKFNSAAIPTELVESELFGYEKGAFTGAASQKLGKLELAHNGSIFLDEIGDMSLSAQAKILRVMQEGTFERVGGNKTISIDVRIIAATNKNLEQMIEAQTFREDLFYRLNVIPISIPPLRDRPGDIEALVNHFLNYFALELRIKPKEITPAALALITKYPFPGNARELKNLIERLYILVSNDSITAEDFAPHIPTSRKREQPDLFTETKNFREAKSEFETRYLTVQLKQYRWNISAVAEKLGMHQPNLSRKIKELGIKRDK